MTTLTDSGQGMDVAIGGLGFRLAINKERPYERATAQFRKEQFDSSPTVGDQSLTGWWTRGQLSFHGGAGTKFYEVLDGEEILNTWYNGRNADPGLGELNMAPLMSAASVADVRDVAQVTNYVTNYFLFAKSTGNLTVAPELATYLPGAETTFSATGTVNAITAAPGVSYAWIADGTAVKVYQHGAGALTTQFTHSAQITHLWYLKRRLWFVDVDGRFYMVAADRSLATTASDAFYQSTEFAAIGHGRGRWKAAETPGAVYLARENQVWAIALDESAVAPAPAPPVLAAVLPSRDTISSLGYLLGHLVIPTVKGIRFAAVDGIKLVYGPLVATEVDFSPSVRVAARGETAYVAGRDLYKNGSGVYAFDLGGMVTPLRPAYWLRHRASNNTIGDYAGVVAPEKLYAWFGGSSATVCVVADGVWDLTRAYSVDTSVTTGYHRFGTLEKKSYRHVTVRAQGSGGTIQVWRKDDPNDLFTRTLIGTLTLPADTEVTLPLGLASPQGAVALEFVLAPKATDNTVAPTLLGYQLKALPAPVRQRMIRVPLLCMDEESRGGTPATGYDGSAHDRLTALEVMEASGGVHDYQDYRTGETGTVFIESIEHRGTTPPSAQSDGYGGIVWVTLRKID